MNEDLLKILYKNSASELIHNQENINIIDVFKLYYNNYAIFLTGKFFNSSCFYNFKKYLLSYFDKYDIVYFNYANKNDVINIINLINTFIKTSNLEERTHLINILYSNNKNFEITKKMKPLCFSENMYEPDILYKKIQFSNQELFITFDNYVIKKTEYKLRTFCQIAEKLGAKKIIIDYYSSENKESDMSLNLELITSSFGGNSVNKEENNESIKIIFEYPSNVSGINLNKYYIINSILNENEFLITKEEFESELELKFLIDARCLNFIQKYNTNFIISHLNKIEQKIFMKAHSYGLNIGNMNLKNNTVKFSVIVEFLQISDNLDIIDGTNIHIMREGFNYLSNILQKEGKYIKLLRFLESHVYALQKKWIYTNYDNEYDTKSYYNIINLNFKEDEICGIIKDFFNNNLTWTNFKKFRDIILRGSVNTELEKLYFVSYQYHDINNNKKNILGTIRKVINLSYDLFIENFRKKKIKIIDTGLDLGLGLDKDNLFIDLSSQSLDEFSSHSVKFNIIELPSCDHNSLIMIDFLEKNRISIIDLLNKSFKKSFKFIDGLSDNIVNSEKLSVNIKNIINYYYDNDLKKVSYEPLFDINELIDKVCHDVIRNQGINVNDYSPAVFKITSVEKFSLYQRVQKIFLKFVIKYFDYELDLTKLTKYPQIKKKQIKNSIIEPELLIDFLNDNISINKVYKNYNKNKIFYTWEDFLLIKNYFM